MSRSQISKFIDTEKGVRATVLQATDAAQSMCKIQNTLPLASMFLSRSVVAAALLASQLKENELVSLYFNGDGPIESVFAEANYEGEVRGYTPQPQLNLPLKNNKLDLSAAIGRGTLSVVRTHAQGTTPYRGTVEIQTGEVGDDVAYYLHQSHQIKSVVSLGVMLSAYGQVQAAGGVLIELLPDANDAIEIIVAERVKEASSLSEALLSGISNREILNLYLDGFNIKELHHPYQISYTCKCNVARVERSLQLLPLDELDEILKKKETVKAKCEFCGAQYEIESESVKKIRDEKYRNSLN